MKKQKKKRYTFYYLNYKNLIGEIEHYGHMYTWKKMLITYGVVVLLAICAGMLYKLPLYGIIIIVVFSVLVTPFLIINGYKSSYEQKRFSDVSRYLEKILHYFKSSGKILDALRDILKIFPEGTMHDSVENTIFHIENDYANGDVLKESLRIIEKEYKCDRLKTVNNFMVNAERQGGDFNMAIDILLVDRKLWVDRTVEMQRSKADVKTKIIISLLITISICLAILYVPQIVGDSMQFPDISTYFIVQVSSIIFIISEVLIYIKADKNLCINWLDSHSVRKDEQIQDIYYRVNNYDEKKEIKKSLMWSLGTVVITVLAFLLMKNMLIMLGGGIIAVFMFNQHTIGYKVDKKNMTKELECAFPSWLLNIALLLQSENVRVAISNSLATAPAALKPAIEELIIELEKDPDSEIPYNNFLKEYNLPEIQDAMYTLYSISSGAGGDSETEFKGIMDSIIKMTDKAEKLKNEDRVAVMGTLVSLPAVIGGFKLLIDMAALLVAFFSMKIV